MARSQAGSGGGGTKRNRNTPAGAGKHPSPYNTHKNLARGHKKADASRNKPPRAGGGSRNPLR
jgi:hypothetical protein